jgi:hypothetical protein
MDTVRDIKANYDVPSVKKLRNELCIMGVSEEDIILFGPKRVEVKMMGKKFRDRKPQKLYYSLYIIKGL